MKAHFKLIVLSGLTLLAISCKKEYETSETSSYVDSTTAFTESSTPAKGLPKRQFIRTADIRFRVKDVAKSTESIEGTVQRFGGFVTYTNLRSTVSEKKTVAVSLDSLVETTRYTVENTITLRVPNQQLDTVLTTIGRQAAFLDVREIKAEDAALNILAQKMTQNRNNRQGERITNAIDAKGKKLNDVIDAETTVSNRNEVADNAYLTELSLRDQVAFSTVTLGLYQTESLKTELLPNFENAASFRPHFGVALIESLQSGWYILEGLVLFFLRLWPLLLIVLAIILFSRKYFVKKLG